MITIYGKAGCPYCVAAKAMCQTLSVEHEYVDIFSSPDSEKEYKQLSEKYSHFSVPLILAGGEFIGGFTELQASQKSGELDQLIKKDS